MQTSPCLLTLGQGPHNIGQLTCGLDFLAGGGELPAGQKQRARAADNSAAFADGPAAARMRHNCTYLAEHEHGVPAGYGRLFANLG